jgi:uncharacterized membrane protein (DUF2068 family)
MPESPTEKPVKKVEVKRRAPTLYFIIGVKLLKGIIFLLLAFGVYRLSDENLPEIFQQLLKILHLDPEKKFFADLADKIESISEAKMVWLAGGTLLYSLFSLVEGIGLLFRVSWAGWLAIGESAFFIPIEIFELVHRPFNQRSFYGVLAVLALNVMIVWYLFQNRRRLFKYPR